MREDVAEKNLKASAGMKEKDLTATVILISIVDAEEKEAVVSAIYSAVAEEDAVAATDVVTGISFK